MKRIGTLAAAAVLGTTLLTSCSGGTDEYCGTLSDAQEQFSALDDADAGAIEDFSNVADDLEAQAPDEVKDQWKTVTGAFDELETSLEEAGLTLEDLEQMSETGEMPEGVEEEDLAALGETMNSFGQDLQTAGDEISTHAKDECDIDLEQS